MMFATKLAFIGTESQDLPSFSEISSASQNLFFSELRLIFFSYRSILPTSFSFPRGDCVFLLSFYCYRWIRSKWNEPIHARKKARSGSIQFLLLHQSRLLCYSQCEFFLIRLDPSIILENMPCQPTLQDRSICIGRHFHTYHSNSS